MPELEARVREAETEDVAKIAELNAALFREDAGRRDPFVDQSWPRREGREYFDGLPALESSLCLLAESGGEVVGYLVGYMKEKVSLRPVAVAELESMYVEEGYRGCGIGAKLANEFLRWAADEGADRVSVTAYSANERAIRFYERLGFKPRNLSLERSAG